MELRTKLCPVGSRMSPDGEPADAWHDAKVAHALVRAMGEINSFSNRHAKARADELMREWGAEQSAREGQG